MYDCILVVVDGSLVFDCVLEEVIKLVGFSGGKLCVIIIVDSLLCYFFDYVVYYNFELLCEVVLKVVDDVLVKVCEKVEVSNVEGVIFDCVCQECVSEEIVECIEFEVQVSDVDVVVMGIYGCCGMCCLMFGSVVEGLICVVLCLVLLVCDK